MSRNIRIFVFKRIALSIPVLFIVTLISFLVVALAPESIIFSRLGFDATGSQVESLRAELGLDDPLHIRYGDWLIGLLHGDLGNSYINGEPVVHRILLRVTVSSQLAFFALIWVVILSSIFGLVSAFNRGERIDGFIRAYAILGISVPDYVVGVLLILVFGVHIGILPVGGWASLSDGVIPYLKHMVLPSYTVAFIFIGLITRMFRSDILEIINKGHVKTAKSLGLPMHQIIIQDVIKPAAIPTMTIFGIALPTMLSGLVMTEIIFAIPGLGRLAVDSVFNGDIPVLQGIMVIVALFFVFSNLLVDTLYFYLDPRIRHKED